MKHCWPSGWSDIEYHLESFCTMTTTQTSKMNHKWTPWLESCLLQFEVLFSPKPDPWDAISESTKKITEDVENTLSSSNPRVQERCFLSLRSISTEQFWQLMSDQAVTLPTHTQVLTASQRHKLRYSCNTDKIQVYYTRLPSFLLDKSAHEAYLAFYPVMVTFPQRKSPSEWGAPLMKSWKRSIKHERWVLNLL